MDPDKFLSAKGDSRLNAIYSLRCFLGLARMDCIVWQRAIFSCAFLVSDEVPTSCL